jgi:hypothetical protein
MWWKAVAAVVNSPGARKFGGQFAEQAGVEWVNRRTGLNANTAPSAGGAAATLLFRASDQLRAGAHTSAQHRTNIQSALGVSSSQAGHVQAGNFSAIAPATVNAMAARRHLTAPQGCAILRASVAVPAVPRTPAATPRR